MATADFLTLRSTSQVNGFKLVEDTADTIYRRIFLALADSCGIPKLTEINYSLPVIKTEGDLITIFLHLALVASSPILPYLYNLRIISEKLLVFHILLSEKFLLWIFFLAFPLSRVFIVCHL